MERKIEVRCVNDGKMYRFAPGTSLAAFAAEACPIARDRKGKEYPVLAAVVDHKLKDLSYEMFYSHEVEFIGYNHPDGRRTYVRSLAFLLQHAVRQLFPRLILVIDHALPSGYYCELLELRKDADGRTVVYPVTPEEIDALQAKMRETAARNLPISKTKMLAEEAEALFESGMQFYKSELTKSLGRTKYLWGKVLGIYAVACVVCSLIAIGSYIIYASCFPEPIFLIYVKIQLLIILSAIPMTSICTFCAVSFPEMAAPIIALMAVWFSSLTHRLKIPVLNGGILPDLDLFNMKEHVIYQVDLPWSYILGTALYGVAFAVFVMMLSGIIFRLRDIK